MRPVVPLAGRRLTARLEAGSARLPPGTEVAPSTWLVHTRADLYDDPLTFRPERWVDAPAPGYAWIPFGGGVRRCIGAEFAQFEMRVVLDVVLRRRDLAPAGPRVERPVRRNVTLAPHRGGPHLGARRRVAAQLTGSEPFRRPSAASSNADVRRSRTERSVASDWKNRAAKPGLSERSA